ncbi:MAG: DUF1858 domain-containing protein [Thermodesulfobacteriota bacterium]
MSEGVITQDMSIGDVLAKYPATEKVFLKFFGDGCFTCPGSKLENIAFGATMHNVDAELVVKELNEALAGE